LHACFLRPKSRGRITLASANPDDKVKIESGYLSDAGDVDIKAMREALHLSRKILAQEAFSAYRGEELLPGSQVQDDEAIDAFIRRKGESIYHPIGTCKMGGSEDANAVVDPQCRVRGVNGLRVVDASIMPKLIGGNTNGPTMMIAERAADMILGKALLFR